MESTARNISPTPNLAQVSATSPENIALGFAETGSLKSRKKKGVFYTPISVVDEMLEAALGATLRARSNSEILVLSVLDPACGSGIFLIRALRLFMRELTARGCGAECALHVVQHCLYGVDCDPQAAALAAQLLVQSAREYFPEIPDDAAINVRSGNSLLDPDAKVGLQIPSDLHPFSWRKNFPHLLAEAAPRGFDFVLGNPPYGLSRGDQIGAQENSLLQRIYEDSRQGKINKYLAFMALGLRLLSDSGELSFIVPNAWLGISGGKKMRETLLHQEALQSITVYDYPVFGDPSVEAIIFRAKKGSRSSEITVTRKKKGMDAPRLEVRVPVTACLDSDNYKIPLLWNRDLAPLVSKLQREPLRLGSSQSPFLPMIALQAYAYGKGEPPQTREQVKTHCFHTSSPESADAHRYLEGADIGRYRISWSGTYLRHGKFLAEPQDLSRFSGPRVLLREILNPAPHLLSACYTGEVFLYNKSVLHIISKTSLRPELMQALCALLNSKLISFYIRMCGCKSQRSLFPKIVNDDLRSIPLVPAFFSRSLLLAELCERRRESEDCALDVEIDAEIFDAYDIDAAQQRHILSFLGL